MRQRLWLMFFVCLFVGASYGQADILPDPPEFIFAFRDKNLAYFEFFGSGSWASLNYERMLKKNFRMRIGLNGGGNLIMSSYLPYKNLLLSIGVQREPYLLKWWNNHVELSYTGPEYRVITAIEYELFIRTTRYWKISLINFIRIEKKVQTDIWCGVSNGFTF